jgi:NAD(P) transhydrogenase subunit alpha
MIQSGAGAGASFPDEACTAVGAQIADAASAFGAELALKVQSPTASELPFMKRGAVLGQVDVVLVLWRKRCRSCRE